MLNIIFHSFIWTILLGLVQSQTCPNVLYQVQTPYDPNSNSFTPDLNIQICNCGAKSDQGWNLNNIPGQTLCVTQGDSAPIFRLVLQSDTHEYKWYPDWSQYVDLSYSPYYEYPSCTLVGTAVYATPNTAIAGGLRAPNAPSVNYNATSEYSTGGYRCNLGATYCSVTGKDCINSLGASLQVTAFDVTGVPCGNGLNGTSIGGFATLYNIIIQVDEYQFEQCWANDNGTSFNTLGKISGGSHSNSTGYQLSASATRAGLISVVTSSLLAFLL